MGIDRKTIFRLSIGLIPLLFFVLLEIFLQIVQYGGNLDLFITPGDDSGRLYFMGNPNVSRRYFLSDANSPNPTKDLILKKKPDNGYRVFVFGGSSAAGFPYGDNLKFSRFLQRQLEAYLPGKKIEVINTAMTAINSYAFIDLIDEVLEQKPDCILVYAGHNEFYGAMGVASLQSFSQARWMIKTYLALKKYRTFLLLRDLIGRSRIWFSQSITGNPIENESATLMERIVSDQIIPEQCDLYRKGMKQFRSNMSEFLTKTSRAGIPVILSEVVSNLRDQPPLEGRDSEAFQTYRRAQEMERAEAYDKARELYYRAKDSDEVRFRAPEDINLIIHNLGKEFAVAVVPLKQVFETASPNHFIGYNLMTDHLHPNMNGYYLMATAFLQTMRTSELIKRKQPVFALPTLKDWGITALDTVCAALQIRYLRGGWPFQPEGTVNTALRNFHCVSMVDTLALKVLMDGKYTIESAHMDLADYYIHRAQFDHAYREYQALISTIPYEVSFYESAAKMLIKKERYQKALNLLERSLSIKETEFNTKWTGQILLLMDRIEAAIPYLQKAREFGIEDLQLLYNLCRAYIVCGKFSDAYTIFNYVKENYPNSPYLVHLKNLAEERQPKYRIASRIIFTADSLFKNHAYDTALSLYQQTASLIFSPYALLREGEIYLIQKKYDKAADVLEKAYQMNPNNEEIAYNFALTNFALKKYTESELIICKIESSHMIFKDPSRLRQRLHEILYK